jgi:hypothetical protein
VTAMVKPGCCPPPATPGTRSLFGWSPSPLPADTPAKRWVDRLLPRTGIPLLLYFAAIVALLNISPHLPLRGALAVDGLAALLGGGWCSLNFWRCRHAHCLVTGAGWLLLAALSFAEAGLARSLIAGHEQLVLLGILGASLGFEALWTWLRGGNAIRLAAPGQTAAATAPPGTGASPPAAPST